LKPLPILQVEDVEDDITLMQLAVAEAQLDCPLISVRDGQEAIDYLSGAGEYAERQRYPLPRLILLDLKLPRVSGLEVLRWIRHESQVKSVVVLVMTSSTLQRDINQAYLAGANSFMTKPSGILELIDLLKALETFWFRLSELPVPEVDPKKEQSDGLGPGSNA
jgi:CheY-like chemotaxis protein